MLSIGKMFEKEDTMLSVAVGAIVGGLYVTNLADGLALTKSTADLIIGLLCKVFILATLVFCAKAILTRVNKTLLGVCIAVVAVLPLQAILFRDTWPFFWDTYVTFVLSIFPGMICFSVLRDYRKCLRVLLFVSIGISLANWMVLFVGGGDAFAKYNMGYANALVLPTNLLIWVCVQGEKHWRMRLVYGALAAGNVIGIFAYGSRGALACVLVFGVFLFFSVPIPHKYGRRIKAGIALAAVLLLVFYRPILTVVLNVLESMGFQSRTLSLLVTDIGHDSGRMLLWEKVWKDFTTNVIAIRGINSDYALIQIYSHNAVLELLHAFGILGGTVLLAGGAWGIVGTLKRRTDAYGMLRVLTMFSFMPLCFWSGSVWTSMYLWLWVVICLRRKSLDKGDDATISLWPQQTAKHFR